MFPKLSFQYPKLALPSQENRLVIIFIMIDSHTRAGFTKLLSSLVIAALGRYETCRVNIYDFN